MINNLPDYFKDLCDALVDNITAYSRWVDNHTLLPHPEVLVTRQVKQKWAQTSATVSFFIIRLPFWSVLSTAGWTLQRESVRIFKPVKSRSVRSLRVFLGQAGHFQLLIQNYVMKIKFDSLDQKGHSNYLDREVQLCVAVAEKFSLTRSLPY